MTKDKNKKDPKIELVNNHLEQQGIKVKEWEEKAFFDGLIAYLKPLGISINSSFGKEIIKNKKNELAEKIMIEQFSTYSKKNDEKINDIGNNIGEGK